MPFSVNEFLSYVVYTLHVTKNVYNIDNAQYTYAVHDHGRCVYFIHQSQQGAYKIPHVVLNMLLHAKRFFQLLREIIDVPSNYTCIVKGGILTDNWPITFTDEYNQLCSLLERREKRALYTENVETEGKKAKKDISTVSDDEGEKTEQHTSGASPYTKIKTRTVIPLRPADLIVMVSDLSQHANKLYAFGICCGFENNAPLFYNGVASDEMYMPFLQLFSEDHTQFVKQCDDMKGSVPKSAILTSTGVENVFSLYPITPQVREQISADMYTDMDAIAPLFVMQSRPCLDQQALIRALFINIFCSNIRAAPDTHTLSDLMNKNMSYTQLTYIINKEFITMLIEHTLLSGWTQCAARAMQRYVMALRCFIAENRILPFFQILTYIHDVLTINTDIQHAKYIVKDIVQSLERLVEGVEDKPPRLAPPTVYIQHVKQGTDVYVALGVLPNSEVCVTRETNIGQYHVMRDFLETNPAVFKYVYDKGRDAVNMELVRVLQMESSYPLEVCGSIIQKMDEVNDVTGTNPVVTYGLSVLRDKTMSDITLPSNHIKNGIAHGAILKRAFKLAVYAHTYLKGDTRFVLASKNDIYVLRKSDTCSMYIGSNKHLPHICSNGYSEQNDESPQILDKYMQTKILNSHTHMFVDGTPPTYSQCILWAIELLQYTTQIDWNLLNAVKNAHGPCLAPVQDLQVYIIAIHNIDMVRTVQMLTETARVLDAYLFGSANQIEYKDLNTMESFPHWLDHKIRKSTCSKLFALDKNAVKYGLKAVLENARDEKYVLKDFNGKLWIVPSVFVYNSDTEVSNHMTFVLDMVHGKKKLPQLHASDTAVGTQCAYFYWEYIAKICGPDFIQQLSHMEISEQDIKRPSSLFWILFESMHKWKGTHTVLFGEEAVKIMANAVVYILQRSENLLEDCSMVKYMSDRIRQTNTHVHLIGQDTNEGGVMLVDQHVKKPLMLIGGTPNDTTSMMEALTAMYMYESQIMFTFVPPTATHEVRKCMIIGDVHMAEKMNGHTHIVINSVMEHFQAHQNIFSQISMPQDMVTLCWYRSLYTGSDALHITERASHGLPAAVHFAGFCLSGTFNKTNVLGVDSHKLPLMASDNKTVTSQTAYSCLYVVDNQVPDFLKQEIHLV